MEGEQNDASDRWSRRHARKQRAGGGEKEVGARALKATCGAVGQVINVGGGSRNGCCVGDCGPDSSVLLCEIVWSWRARNGAQVARSEVIESVVDARQARVDVGD